jgi:threonyl-tRNA synthetase
VIPVAESYEDYARQVCQRLFDLGIRVEVDSSAETMKYKIRQAQTHQVPYMLVVGERERAAGAVAVRHRRQGDLGSMSLDAFLERLQREIASKTRD